MSTMTSCPGQDVLKHFSLGQVRESEAPGLEAHLAGCPDCVATLHDIHGEDTLLDAMRAQPAPGARLKIDARVTQLMVVLKGWKPTASLHGDGASDATEADSGEELTHFLAPPEQPDELGRLGSYRILAILGTGGMGVVFHAEDLQLRRPVALKVLRPLLAVNGSARKRFLREARAAASLAHDNIVTIYQVGEERGIPFLAMPYLSGETLETRLRRDGPLPLPDILHVGRQLADALSTAHAQGLLHRDIKPTNIWLEARADGRGGAGLASPALSIAPRVKLLDFGLAWVADDSGPLTECGTVVGTPAYMAPEQARGESADVRSDLFSLGSVLYAMCTGQAPFNADSNFATLEKVRTETPHPIGEINPAVPPWLVEIVTKLHAKNPADRCQSAATVGALLQAPALANPTARSGDKTCAPVASPPSSRKWWATAVGLLLLPTIGLTLCEATGTTQIRDIVAGLGAQPDTAKLVTNTKDGEPPGSPELAAIPAIPASASQSKKIEPAPAEQAPTVYPAALFVFEERGAAVRDFGAKVTDILFAKLAARPELYLVDRTDLKKILGELELNLSGAVKPAEANKIGQLTGAKLLISGSILQVDKKTYLIAKIVGTETSRVFGVSVDGKSTDELAPLVEKLAEQIAETVAKKADQLAPKAAPIVDRIAELNKKLKGKRPTVMVQIKERHIGAVKIDPAAETEVSKFCKETGFTLIDPEQGVKGKADILIVGEAFSETVARHGNLIGVKARVEIKAIDRKTDKILAVDRQTAVIVDLAENIAGKAAIQEAAAILAERILPKLTK